MAFASSRDLPSHPVFPDPLPLLPRPRPRLLLREDLPLDEETLQATGSTLRDSFQLDPETLPETLLTQPISRERPADERLLAVLLGRSSEGVFDESAKSPHHRQKHITWVTV